MKKEVGLQQCMWAVETLRKITAITVDNMHEKVRPCVAVSLQGTLGFRFVLGSSSSCDILLRSGSLRSYKFEISLMPFLIRSHNTNGFISISTI